MDPTTVYGYAEDAAGLFLAPLTFGTSLVLLDPAVNNDIASTMTVASEQPGATVTSTVGAVGSSAVASATSAVADAAGNAASGVASQIEDWFANLFPSGGELLTGAIFIVIVLFLILLILGKVDAL